MASRRMMAVAICESDGFLDMPMTSQGLYFHLMLAADDDGIVDAPRKTLRAVGATAGDLKVLVDEGFVYEIDGMVVIKHWCVHNRIAPSKRVQTVHQSVLAQLEKDRGGTYHIVKGKKADRDKLTEQLRFLNNVMEQEKADLEEKKRGRKQKEKMTREEWVDGYEKAMKDAKEWEKENPSEPRPTPF